MFKLFETKHGSHLYGTAHAGSDLDYFCVVEKQKKASHDSKPGFSRQTFKKSEEGLLIDMTVVDLTTFMVGCEKGVPQYLEAMFSQEPEVDLIEDMRRGYVAGATSVQTYLRTIKGFSYDERDKGNKMKRHALRLAYNVRGILEEGRFDPRLSPEQVVEFTELSTKTSDEVYEAAMTIVWN